MMPYAQYCRIETAAGGTWASCRAFVRAARRLLSEHGKSRNMRDIRHEWLRAGLQHLSDAQDLCREFRL